MRLFYVLMSIAWFVSFLFGINSLVSWSIGALTLSPIYVMLIVLSPMLCIWNINKAIKHLSE